MKTAINRTLAKGDIVFFGTGEVSKGGSPGFRRNDAEVAWNASCKEDAGFCFPVGDDFFHIGCGDEGLHNLFRFVGSSNEIEVFDDFFSPAETAPDFRFFDSRRISEMSEQGLCGRKSVSQTVELAVGSASGDRLQQVGGSFFAEAVEGGETAVLAGFFQGFEGFNF